MADFGAKLNNNILTNSSSQSKSMNVNLMKLQNDSSYIQISNFVHNLTNNLIKEKYLNFLSMPRMLTLINNNEGCSSCSNILSNENLCIEIPSCSKNSVQLRTNRCHIDDKFKS